VVDDPMMVCMSEPDTETPWNDLNEGQFVNFGDHPWITLDQPPAVT